MSRESSSRSPEVNVSTGELESSQARHCLVIPGMFATNSGMRSEFGIGPAFEQVYGGPEQVSTFNSIISTDKPNPHRFEEMADVIMRYAAGGLDVVMHSLGTSEARRALKLIRRRNPDFFNNPQHKENLRFVIIGPSGYSQGLERFAYPKRVIQDSLDPTLNATTAFPPQGISPETLTQVLAELSNRRSDIPMVGRDINIRDNEQYLTQTEQEELAAYDRELQRLAESDNTTEAKRVLKARAGAARRPLQQVFAGTTVIDATPKGRIMSGGRQGLGVLLRAGGKKPMREFMQLSAMGYTVDFIVPEYDTVKPLRTIRRFFQGQETPQNITVIEGSSHAGFALQPDLYAHAISNRN